MILSDEQQEAVQSALDGGNVFVSGQGGVGKSVAISKIVETLRNKGRIVAITASTGIAALSIGGCTIHSFLGSGISNNIKDLKKKMSSIRNLRLIKDTINSTDTLVIDEVSMLTGDYFDMMNYWLKNIKNNIKPFGGIQLIVVGDFLQLPPVVKQYSNIEKEFAFESDSWWDASFSCTYLTKSFRQDDIEFIEHLNNIRNGSLTEDTKQYFNKRVGIKLKDPTRLFSYKKDVKATNKEHIDKLPGTSQYFDASVYGSSDHWVEKIKNDCMAEEFLELKIGAPVIFISNSNVYEYANGERGIVTSINDSCVEVEKQNGSIVPVFKYEWNIVDGLGDNKATMKQIPLLLAYAMTIHKSQGLTLDLLKCDVSTCFAPGQAYVALSRARSIDGMSLVKPLSKSNIYADQRSIEFYKLLNDAIMGETNGI